ncbi:hypothetical protein [uncultured Sphingomonas sp.]|uniref:hypothetical protein n=1 Tax=uncultured Sphingomonas sp. TaxID=158754 RepID=UPI00261A6A9D|nr:hypothetical protein [uncultured Sphingomonas sp.]
MVRSNTPPDAPEVLAAIPLGEWMNQMMARDNQMWEQLNRRDNDMQKQLLELFSQLLAANSVDRVVVSGFDEMGKLLREQMGPLRTIGRDYGELDQDTNRRLETLQKALERQDFSQVSDEGAIRGIANVGKGSLVS